MCGPCAIKVKRVRPGQRSCHTTSVALWWLVVNKKCLGAWIARCGRSHLALVSSALYASAAAAQKSAHICAFVQHVQTDHRQVPILRPKGLLKQRGKYRQLISGTNSGKLILEYRCPMALVSYLREDTQTYARHSSFPALIGISTSDVH